MLVEKGSKSPLFELFFKSKITLNQLNSDYLY